jgi:hypothetical protein
MSELSRQSPFDPATERRLVIIADWLPPDFGAVGQYMQMRAISLAERGHDVTLVGLSSVAGSVTSRSVGAGTLTEMRLAARQVPRTSLVGRMLWTIAIDLRLLFEAFSSLRAAHGVIFTGSPPFMVHFLTPLKLLLRGRLIYRITDFYPECLIAARKRRSLVLEALLALTNFWRRRIDGFEVLGEDQLRRLRATGVAEKRITLVRDGSPVAFAADLKADPLPAELAGHCVLLYSGNYGVAHEVDTVLEGYRRHHREGTGRVRLWLSAAGAGAAMVAERLREEGLPLHRSAPVPLERLAGLLRSPHAHLITLKDDFVGYVLPSKIYACLASKKSLIFVGSAESDVELLARGSAAGYRRVPCGDPAGFAAALEELSERVARASVASLGP